MSKTDHRTQGVLSSTTTVDDGRRRRRRVARRDGRTRAVRRYLCLARASIGIATTTTTTTTMTMMRQCAPLESTFIMPSLAHSADVDTARGRREHGMASSSSASPSSSLSSLSRERGARRRTRDEEAADDGRAARGGRRRRREDSRGGDDDDGRQRRSRSRDRARRSRSRDGVRGGPLTSTTLAERARRDGDGGRYGAADDQGADVNPGPLIPKEEASFALSGLLAAESNSVKGVALKYIEPRGEAKLPTQKWRLYCFKGKEECEEPYKISAQTKYLIGRDRTVVDIPSDHPSCSKQHCVVQFRDVDDGEGAQPYVFDLGSTNGTFVNKKRIDANVYIKLKAKDTLGFGHSTRVYVLLHEDVV